MNDSRNKKDFNSPRKKTFNKSGNTNSKFGGKKKYPSKYGSTDKGAYSEKSGEYPAKKSYNKYGSSSSEKEYKSKKFGHDKPYSKDDADNKKPYESKYKKPYNREDKPFGDKDRYEKKPYKSHKPDEYNSERNTDKPYNREKPPYKKVYRKDNDYDKEKSYSKSYERKESSYSNDRFERKENPFKKKLIKKGSFEESENQETTESTHEYGGEQGSFRKKLIKKEFPYKNEYDRDSEESQEKRKSYEKNSFKNEKKLYRAGEKYVKTIKPYEKSESDGIRLNKYIATSGICSRREADELIASGAVSVNGKVVTEMGVKVLPTDIIQYGGETLKNERNVYLLLNKPKDFITTSDDPFNRKTVMSLVHKACKERIYPVGRLDRMTTGLLLFTNDGEMAKKLTHPKHGIKKIYQVELDKALTKSDMVEITNGVELEDGIATVDIITYLGDGTDKKTLGLELHSGKNRIVRRIFEHLGYNVVKLDRVYFAGLTKKDLPRGRHRFLTPEEINMLKIIS